MPLPSKPNQFIYIKNQESHYLSIGDFNIWYDNVFKGAVEVECTRSLPDQLGAWYASENGIYPKTHTALLVNIEPIKKETAEDILKDMVEEYKDTEKYKGERGPFWGVFERAERYLNGKA